ncbi:hypothetical protein ACS0TY_003795 [Phlomoides rotata]
MADPAALRRIGYPAANGREEREDEREERRRSMAPPLSSSSHQRRRRSLAQPPVAQPVTGHRRLCPPFLSLSHPRKGRRRCDITAAAHAQPVFMPPPPPPSPSLVRIGHHQPRLHTAATLGFSGKVQI